jgi:hypothetical protein
MKGNPAIRVVTRTAKPPSTKKLWPFMLGLSGNYSSVECVNGAGIFIIPESGVF